MSLHSFFEDSGTNFWGDFWRVFGKVSEGFWQLYPSNQGRRIVILVQDSQRRFVGNDNDEESLNFRAAEGDKLEIHYPNKGLKRLIIVE